MLNLIWVVAVLLIALWLLGMLTSFTMGGLIHVLLVVAIIAVVARLIVGRQSA
jgi:hypothetical protein